MDKALIEDSKDDIDHNERCEDENRHGRERTLKGLGVALETCADGGRQVQLGLGTLDCTRGLTVRCALSQAPRRHAWRTRRSTTALRELSRRTRDSPSGFRSGELNWADAGMTFRHDQDTVWFWVPIATS